jgi:hypothetical protein
MGRNLYANAHPEALKDVKYLVEATIAGDRVKKEMLLERLGTTDGVFAFANLTNVQLQKNYAEAPSIWQKFATRVVVGDFRQINWINFGEDFSNWKAADKGVVRHPLALPKVAEGEKYQAFSLNQTTLGFANEKFGAQIGFTWEAFINDPYQTVARIPGILTRTAVRTLDANATKALVAAALTQPKLAAVAAGDGLEAVLANNSLTFSALSRAVEQLKAKNDAAGNSVTTGRLILSVGPALVAQAERILAQNTLRTRIATSGSSYTETETLNLFGNIEILENPYLPFYAGNATTWILSPAGGTDTGADPVVLQSFLAGEEEPEIRVSGLAGYSPSGNALPYTSGSFDTDTFDLRIRVVGGAGVVNPLPVILSEGDNT